jgi:hypothetical protein
MARNGDLHELRFVAVVGGRVGGGGVRITPQPDSPPRLSGGREPVMESDAARPRQGLDPHHLWSTENRNLKQKRTQQAFSTVGIADDRYVLVLCQVEHQRPLLVPVLLQYLRRKVQQVRPSLRGG